MGTNIDTQTLVGMIIQVRLLIPVGYPTRQGWAQAQVFTRHPWVGPISNLYQDGYSREYFLTHG
jgi:hypothetical protein